MLFYQALMQYSSLHLQNYTFVASLSDVFRSYVLRRYASIDLKARLPVLRIDFDWYLSQFLPHIGIVFLDPSLRIRLLDDTLGGVEIGS